MKFDMGSARPRSDYHFITNIERTYMSLVRGFGWLVMALGACVVGYALFVFDVSVSTAIGRVNNMGLLQDKQNFLVAGGVMAVVGVLIALFGPHEPVAASSKGADGVDLRRVFAVAIRDNDLPRVSEMLESGEVDPNGSLRDKGESWLTIAAEGPRPLVVEILLKRGADPKAVDGTGLSPLQALVNRTPEKGTKERTILELMRDPPEVELVAQKLREDDSLAHGKLQDNSPNLKDAFASQLIELGKMRESGLLTPEEFAAAKSRLMAT